MTCGFRGVVGVGSSVLGQGDVGMPGDQEGSSGEFDVLTMP
ncbi:MAG: hypothetical protein OEO17_08600 [Gemmatimonadota bacterium]|nr:hypothetical protein [Gemmatimonadota bacterium]MDH5551419.1 hypothetical protein [Gemmatimonadota bacterium]